MVFKNILKKFLQVGYRNSDNDATCCAPVEVPLGRVSYLTSYTWRPCWLLLRRRGRMRWGGEVTSGDEHGSQHKIHESSNIAPLQLRPSYPAPRLLFCVPSLALDRVASKIAVALSLVLWVQEAVKVSFFTLNSVISYQPLSHFTLSWKFVGFESLIFECFFFDWID